MANIPPPLLAAVVLCFPAVSAFGDADNEPIDEIVVTAGLRARPASEVPASVALLDAGEIDALAVQHFEELTGTIPNLNWSGDGNRARYFQIRGVGELEQYQGAPNPSVGFLIDDIDFSGIGTVATLFDIERVEVLRGPQGLRYGANALGGLIYLRSTPPSEEFRGHARLTVGGDDTLAGGVAFGGTVAGTDGIIYRLSAHRHSSDGFRDNPWLGRHDTNRRDETTVRGRLQVLSGGSFEVDVAALYADVDDGYDAFALDNSFSVLSDKPGRDAQTSAGLSVRVGYSGLPGATLTSITALADSRIDFDFDADWGNPESWAPVTYDYVSLNHRRRGTLSQEIRLTGKKWLAGAYAMRLGEDLDTLNEGEYYDPNSDYADSLYDTLASHYDATNLAVFGQYEFAFGGATRLSVGLRRERRTTEYSDSTGIALGPSDSLWGGDLSLNRDFGDSLVAYAGLSRGFKAGGFNLGFVPDERREFAAEGLWNLEAGFKASLFDDRLRVNGSAFVNRRIDQQVRTSVQLIPGDPASFTFLTVNADESRTFGVEADVHWTPNDAWMLYASIGTLATEFEKFADQPDLEGRAQAHAPGYSLAAGASFAHASGWFARVDATAKDAFYFDVSHDRMSAAYRLLNARAGFATDRWSIQLWARNLSDEPYAVRGFFFGNEPPDFPDRLYVRLGDPRQFGITLERRF